MNRRFGHLIPRSMLASAANKQTATSTLILFSSATGTTIDNQLLRIIAYHSCITRKLNSQNSLHSYKHNSKSLQTKFNCLLHSLKLPSSFHLFSSHHSSSLSLPRLTPPYSILSLRSHSTTTTTTTATNLNQFRSSLKRNQNTQNNSITSIRCLSTSATQVDHSQQDDNNSLNPALPNPHPQTQLNQLKELSYSIVQRSATQHIVQKQIDRARELCNIYYDADPFERFEFLCFLSDEFSTSLEHANQVSNSFLNTQNREEPYDPALLIDRLRNQIRPRYLELFRYVAKLDNGVKFLVDLRGDLITVLSNAQLLNKQKPSCKVYLRLLSTQLSDLLSLWFSAGFLRLERLTWDSPTSILQKITEYEAVHPIRNWLDLKNRLGLYRRCYMFSHSCLPGEPLVILHVALVPNISPSIQEIIQKSIKVESNPYSSRAQPSPVTTLSPPLIFNDILSSPLPDSKSSVDKLLNPTAFSRSLSDITATEDPSQIDAAIFYSISSTQKGLNGIDLGNQLIKQVAGELKAEYPLLSKFSTLSPIPNFAEYLLSTIQSIQRKDDTKNFRSFWVDSTDLGRLKNHIMTNQNYTSLLKPQSLDGAVMDENDRFWFLLAKILRFGEWINDQVLVELLQEPLMRICAHYLFNEKRRGYALNSVANFHLKNGAVIWRLNWLADTSTRGLSNSCGIMVNYRYFLEMYKENSQIYLNEKRIIAGDKFLHWTSH